MERLYHQFQHRIGNTECPTLASRGSNPVILSAEKLWDMEEDWFRKRVMMNEGGEKRFPK